MEGASTDFLSRIDWDKPWLTRLRGLGEPICARPAHWRDAINAQAQREQLCNHRGQRITFVKQELLPPEFGYEKFIGATGQVPTRDNLHDFFNALIWLTFPRIKSQLNGLQAAEIACRSAVVASAGQQPRGRLRDALTLFDENAALVVASNPTIFAALRAHQWPTVFMTHRDDFGPRCEVVLFGHALLEKLVTPYKAITAHAWLVPVDTDYFQQSAHEKQAVLDDVIARHLDATMRSSDFTPLPVLGVPDWSEGQTEEFYADAGVFRARRRAPQC